MSHDPASMASGLHSSEAATSNGITVVDRRELLLGVRRLGAAARPRVRQGRAARPGGRKRGEDGGAAGPGPDRCHLEGCGRLSEGNAALREAIGECRRQTKNE